MELKEQLQRVFNSDYPGIDTFTNEVLIPVIGDDFETIDKDITIDNKYAERAARAGIKKIIAVADFYAGRANPITLFDVTINNNVNIERARVNIQQLIRSVVDGYHHILIVFHYENPTNESWRFSYAYKIDTLTNTTSAKRYTYVFGRNFRARTAVDRFIDLKDSAKRDEDFEKAFSVQALSDEFFDLYRAYYAVFVEYITGERYTKEAKINNIINGWDWLKESTDYQFIRTFGSDDKCVRDYIKKMFGRIVFLYFVQRKGWLYDNTGTPDYHYMRNLFDNAGKYQDTFLDDILELLFFFVLNTDKDKRANASEAEHKNPSVTILPGWDKIDFLNGGLFSPDDIDPEQCTFPAVYFDKLFEFLDSYNFTIDENDTDDAEVGIDPEMLGRIFENLLEDNKDKGAFYTPKEIVDYMCRESIIAYLQDDRFSEDGNNIIRTFVETYDASLLNEKQISYLIEKLDNVKICDPAIGSGAFPMGLVNILSKLYITLEPDGDSALRKRQILENNIYGVDIEKGAVDIARLRFWLAMVVDEEKATPLPNLDFKIMQGNSLLESYKGFDLTNISRGTNTNGQYTFDFGGNQTILSNDIKQFYNTNDHNEKKNLLDKIKLNVITQIFEQQNNEDFLEDIKDVTANDKFFLWHTWFADVFDNGGFDIVIGNPPYVLLQNTTMSDTEKDTLTSIYKVSQYKVDLYHLFIERGCNLLGNGGVLVYINPTTFLTNNYTSKLRKFIIEDYSLNSVVNITSNVFEASVNTGIFTISNSKNDKILSYSNGLLVNENLVVTEISKCERSYYNKDNNYLIQPLGDDKSQDLISKIENIGCVVKDVASVSFGMQLRNRKIYTEDVLENPDKEQLTEFHRPCLTGKDINFFTSEFANRYCYFNRIAKCGGCWDESLHNAKTKVLIRQVGSIPVCGIDTNGYAILNSAFMIVPNNYNAYCLMGLINSKVIRFYWSVKFEDKRKTFPKIKGTYLEQIPIPSNDSKEIADCAVAISNAIGRGENTDELTNSLDYLVYKFYGLSYNEILLIDPETTITEEEYNNG